MITFDAATHTYTLDGRRIPSVTQILSAGGVIDAKAFYTEYGRERGTALHRAIELLHAGNLDETSIDTAIEGHFLAYQNFLRISRIEILKCEFRVYSASQDFAGTVDLYGTLNDHPVVIDVKTNHAPKWVGVQLAAYQFALREAGFPARRYSLALRGDKNFRLVEHTAVEDIQIFLDALETMRSTPDVTNSNDSTGHDENRDRRQCVSGAGDETDCR